MTPEPKISSKIELKIESSARDNSPTIIEKQNQIINIVPPSVETFLYIYFLYFMIKLSDLDEIQVRRLCGVRADVLWYIRLTRIGSQA